MARFTPIPAIPTASMSDWQYNTLSAMKENIELLTGTRGEKDGTSRALTTGAIKIQPAPTQTLPRITAQGSGVSIDGTVVPDMTDYVELLKNVQMLANDVTAIRNTLNTLISQLRG
jgi:hypothetical protein